MGLDKKHRVVGTRVQDYYGSVGTIRWVGKLTIAKSTNTTIGVQFDDPNGLPARNDGTFQGEQYFEAPPGTAQFMRPELLDIDKITQSVTDVRAAMGPAVRGMHDAELRRFCIARKFELKAVVAMIENNMKWREHAKPTDNIFLPPAMAADYPVGFQDGVDYAGNVIYVERPGNGGRCSAEQFLERYGPQMVVRWHLASMERGLRMMKESNFRSVRTTVIVDLTGLIKTFGALVRFAKLVASIDQDNYPENLAHVFVVNAPGFFTTAWAMVRPFLDARTKEKAFVLEPGKALAALSPYVPESLIPSFAGGHNDSWMARQGVAGVTNPSAAASPPCDMALPSPALVQSPADAPSPTAASPAAAPSPADAPSPTTASPVDARSPTPPPSSANPHE